MSHRGFKRTFKRILGVPIWEIKKRDTFNQQKIIDEIIAAKKKNPEQTEKQEVDKWEWEDLGGFGVNEGFHQQGYESYAYMNSPESDLVETYQYMRDVLESDGGLDFPHQICEGWFNFNKKFQANMPHTHGEVGLASVLFLKNAKGLTFYYPNPFSGIDNHNDAVGLDMSLEFYHVDAEVGDAVVFPSNLLHWVRPHNKEEDRITFACNIKINRF
mgnify:CR=1 FL=1